MWDTVSETATPLSHEMPCPWCGHSTHSFLECSDSCACAGWRSLIGPDESPADSPDDSPASPS